MHGLLEVLAAAAASTAAVAGLTVGIVLRRLRRANRLYPRHKSLVPLSWRWSPRSLAILHRRLRRACELIVAVTGAPVERRSWLRRHPAQPGSVLRAAGAELLERAAAADARLAELGRTSARWRRHQLTAVAAEVDAIDGAAARLARLDDELRREADAALGERSRAEMLLDSFEAALSELRARGARTRAP